MERMGNCGNEDRLLHQINIKVSSFRANKGVGLSWHLTVKKSLKIITEYRVMLEILYHKHDPLITKTESQINSNEKAIYFF